MTDPNQDDKLEQLVHRTLRELPSRRAPSTLEARVLAGLQQRTKQWWRNSFMHWPLAARAAFVALCVVLVKPVAHVSMWLIDGVELAPITSDIVSIAAWLKVTITIAVTIVHNIPTLWIYGSLACIGALYAALFGISAAAYRTLYAPR